MALEKIVKKWFSTSFYGVKLGLGNNSLQDFLPQLAEITCFTSTAVPKFKIPLYGFILNMLIPALPFFELYHVLIDALSGTI